MAPPRVKIANTVLGSGIGLNACEPILVPFKLREATIPSPATKPSVSNSKDKLAANISERVIPKSKGTKLLVIAKASGPAKIRSAPFGEVEPGAVVKLEDDPGDNFSKNNGMNITMSR